MQATIAHEPEPLVTLTHLLHLCRDEHRVLWEGVGDPVNRHRVELVLTELDPLVPAGGSASVLHAAVRAALAAALEPTDTVSSVVVARALAEFLDDRYHHTFTASFRQRSPYQPGVGDPVPLGNPDLRSVTALRPTSPPWRLANRLDETRHVRLAGEWAVQFRVVFDYSLFDTLRGVIAADTVIATCHPNGSLTEFALTPAADNRTFPVRPRDLARQRATIDRLLARATAAGAAIVVLPELCVTESLARELQDWVQRPNGLRLLIAGSYHHEDRQGDDSPAPCRRNTAIGWVRGHDQPLTHDKHSPADRPVVEDIRPQGWPELRVHVTGDGWHLVIAICRDLLNPQAVYALAEAGANLVLAPAMSETLMTFGGPAAHLVGDCQALIAVANNPADWAGASGARARPARALFGHPGLGQQIRLVQSPHSEPGVALLTVRSAEIAWLSLPPSDVRGELAPQQNRPATGSPAKPDWLPPLAARVAAPGLPETGPLDAVSLRPAAVLVLLTDGPSGPCVLLTERAPDLADYPGQLVFPGGAAEPFDDGPVGTALREAHEEVGLDPATLDVIGLLPALALPQTGFLVNPVLAWSSRPAFTQSVNYAEVASCQQIPLSELAARPLGAAGAPGRTDDRDPAANLAALGSMTATVIDLLLGLLSRDRTGPDATSAAPTRHPAQDGAAVTVEG